MNIEWVLFYPLGTGPGMVQVLQYPPWVPAIPVPARNPAELLLKHYYDNFAESYDKSGNTHDKSPATHDRSP